MATNTIFTVDYTNPGLRPFSEEHEDDDQYLVEALLGTRVHRGKKQYLVSWMGEWSPAEKTTWEPAKNVSNEILQELKRSGVVLPSYPGNDGYCSDPKDDVMHLDGDSGSEYDPDDNKDKAHRSSKAKARLRRKSAKANRSRKAKARLSKKSSNVSDDAIPKSDQHGDDSRSPVIAGPATPSEQIDQEQIDYERALALKGDALIAKQKEEIAVMDAEWEDLHGFPLEYNNSPEILTQGPAVQGPTLSRNGFADLYNSMMQQTAQQPVLQQPMLQQPMFQQPMLQQPMLQQPMLQQPMLQQPILQQPVPAPMVRPPGFAEFASDPTLTVDDDSFMDDFTNFAAREDPHDPDEDADGSVISEAEQARYDEMSLWRHMLTTEPKKPNSASPPGFEVNGDAANAPFHGTNNDLTKKRTKTTSAIVAEAATRNARYTEPLATKRGNPDNTHWRSTEPPIQMREVDHELQQEAKEEVIRTAPLSLPTFSLAHQGRFSASSGIPFWTRELNHNATLVAITAEEDGVFICRIRVQIAFTADSCTGTCRIPIANLNSGLAEYYRTHSNHAEAFELEEICDPGSLSGLVRLGRVMSEDESPGTYTCEAEFGSFEADSPWAAEVYVPKKHVPGYKLVDWEGEQNAVTSIESPKREPRLRQVVEFSRHIEYHREQMSATIWSNDGDDYALRTVVQILAYEFDGPQIYLEFRARQHEATWWHFHGRMNREVKHGQFTLSSLPVPNALSDAKFGLDWTDRSLESDLLRRLRELMECTKSLERQVEHLRAVLRLFGAKVS